MDLQSHIQAIRLDAPPKRIYILSLQKYAVHCTNVDWYIYVEDRQSNLRSRCLDLYWMQNKIIYSSLAW
jgi:hypothetical protein